MVADQTSSKVSLCRFLYNSTKFMQTELLAFFFIFLACSRTFLIKFSIRDGGYDYLPVTVNVMAELCKFIVCFNMAFYIKIVQEGKSFREVFHPSHVKWKEFFKWSIPGLLYFFDNLLGFYILVHLPPAVYSLLGNFVIITTAVLFRVVLRRKLSKIQWASLLILFLSIVSLSSMNQTDHHHLDHHHQIIRHHHHTKDFPDPCRHKAIAHNSTAEAQPKISKFHINEGHIFVLVQCVLSSLANIYNEKIFKEDDGMEQSIYMQNSKLYFFGIFFNFFTLILKPNFRKHIFHCGFFSGYNIQSTVLIFVTACYGLTVALILKFRDNMFQVMSFQLSNVLIITSSVLFFDFHPTLEFFLVAPIVLLAIFIFNAGKKDWNVKTSSDNNGHVYSQLANTDS